MSVKSLCDHLQTQTDDNFRGMIKYDNSGINIEYLRNDIERKRIQSQFDRMIDRLAPEASETEENAFPLGNLYATLRYFDDAIVLHLPTSQHSGVVISVEPNVAKQFNGFVNECLQELRSFSHKERREKREV